MTTRTLDKEVSEHARTLLKELIALLPEGNKRIFKLMYGRGKDMGRGKMQRTPEEATALDINDVIDEMQYERLSWAYEQVENTLKKQRPTSDEIANLEGT